MKPRLPFVLRAVFLLSFSALTSAADFEEVHHDGIAFISIPAGQFTMGTSPDNRALLQGDNLWTRFNDCEIPARTVTISKPFLISKFEITQKEWKELMGQNPSAFKGENLPVESVSWNDVQEFVQKLNKQGNGACRLPTEAEWEYCCRAGSTNLFALDLNRDLITRTNLAEHAWLRSNSGNQTHDVGRKKPNAWGLHDMHGNVWEWCLDWYASDFYHNAPSTDPVNTEPSTERVFRGGSWFLDWPSLRAATRGGNLPTFKSQYVGFRLVRDR